MQAAHHRDLIIRAMRNHEAGTLGKIIAQLTDAARVRMTANATAAQVPEAKRRWANCKLSGLGVDQRLRLNLPFALAWHCMLILSFWIGLVSTRKTKYNLSIDICRPNPPHSVSPI